MNEHQKLGFCIKTLIVKCVVDCLCFKENKRSDNRLRDSTDQHQPIAIQIKVKKSIVDQKLSDHLMVS